MEVRRPVSGNANYGLTTVVSDTTTGLVSSVTDALNHTTSYTYQDGLVKRVTRHNGNSATTRSAGGPR
jgi:hypothetical protein